MTELLAASVNSKKGKSSAGGVKLSENKLSMLAHLLLACAKKARGVLDRSKDKATGNAEVLFAVVAGAVSLTCP